MRSYRPWIAIAVSFALLFAGATVYAKICVYPIVA